MGRLFVFELWPRLIFYHLFSIFSKNIKYNFNQGHNGTFACMELGCVPNSTTCSTNATVELLHGRVRGAELEKQKRSSAKHIKYKSFTQKVRIANFSKQKGKKNHMAWTLTLKRLQLSFFSSGFIVLLCVCSTVLLIKWIKKS